jgi:oligoendopeptidase F
VNVDATGQPPLRPFQAADELEQRTAEVFRQVDPALAADFAILREKRLLDLANHPGKAPGGYQSTLSESRLPFIFMNAVGVQRDVETLLHEGGHAFHALASRDEPLFAYRNPPIEFCEVASMSMELLGNEFLEAFYPPEPARRARREHLESIVDILPWVATVDAFQHWLYTHPSHTRDERGQAWQGLMGRFGGDVDWSGHEEARTHLWHKQLHIFCHPFYYVEYGLAQLGALQVWRHYHQNRAGAVAAYRSALSLGGSRPLPELFTTAGCCFDFSANTIRPLMELIRTECEALAS